MVAGTSGGGIYATSDNGALWVPVNTGLTDTNVYAIAVSGTSLCIGTETGVWQYPISKLTTVRESDTKNQQKGFTLNQNYPNPFGEQTQIAFAVSDPQFSGKQLTLQVISPLGNVVRDLYSGVADGLEHTCNLEWKRLQSGVYFARLRCNGVENTMTLIVKH